MRIAYLILLLGLLALTAEAAIQVEPVEYKAGDVTMKGHIAYDDAKQGKRPGVLVIHEWWGLNDYALRRAKMLAELGYTAMAVDMFGGGRTTTHPQEAQKFTQEVMGQADAARQRFLAAMEMLKKHSTVNSEKIAAIGYCFGGSVVLDMARQGVDLDGVVSFHGGLDTKTPAKAVKAKVFVLHGAADEFISAEEIAKFKQEMESAKVDYEFIAYPDAKHSYTNPAADEMAKTAKIPIAYNAEADKKSWEDMKRFLNEIFKN
jgi:dienelactone hydrolase